ncbi:MAG: release factor glutamine methyltransferase [Hyphococcus sp.]|nr:MAG: release factor glutamine methyltransferase [Marinicaulis sp.]
MTIEPVATKSVEKTLRHAVQVLAASPTPLLDARVLIKHVTGFDDAALIAKANDPFPPHLLTAYDELIARRAGGEPVAYISGVKEFWSLEFNVTPDVLIPREDSECLIERVIASFASDAGLSILDLGTGSGCLLCALLDEFKNGKGVGVDRSESALTIAEENARKLALADRATFVTSDWFSAVSEKFDLIIANPPYIREDDRVTLPKDVCAYEPGGALFAGADGLDAYRQILISAPLYLKAGGMMVMEMGFDQSDPLLEMVTKTFPEAEISLIYDLQQRPRGICVDRRAGGSRGQKKD